MYDIRGGHYYWPRAVEKPSLLHWLSEHLDTLNINFRTVKVRLLLLAIIITSGKFNALPCWTDEFRTRGLSDCSSFMYYFSSAKREDVGDSAIVFE
jgi:hypothetical protein